MMEYFYFINLLFVFFSGWVALNCFKEGLARAGWLNVFASAINAAGFASHYF